MKSKPNLQFNKLDVHMCFASQGLDYITNVDWPTRNLNTQLALAMESISTYYTSSSEGHALTINDVCKQLEQSLFMITPQSPTMPKKDEALQYLQQTLR
jgi:hypothetical protein